MRKQKGFSLIELLIVVAIILIIAAIAIPNLLQSRMRANEAAAAQTLRTINTSQVSFSTNYPTVGYADTLQHLGPNTIDCTVPGNVNATHACLIDNVLGCATAPCTKGAYNYTMGAVTNPGADYLATAVPVSTAGGQKRYCTMTDAVIKFDTATVTTVPTAAACQAFNALSN